MSTQALEKTVRGTAAFRNAIGRFFTSTNAVNSLTGETTEDDDPAKSGDDGDPAKGGEDDDDPAKTGEADDDDTPAPTDDDGEGSARAPFSLAEFTAQAQAKLENKTADAGAGGDDDDDDDDDDPAKTGADAPEKTGDDGKTKPEAKDGGGGKTKETKPAAPGGDDKSTVAVTKRRPKAEPLPEPPELKDDGTKKTGKDDAATGPSLNDLTAGMRLSDDELDYLETVQYAETHDKEKHAGLLKREVERLKSLHDYVKKWQDAHPGERFNPDFDDETRRSYDTMRQETGGPALSRRDIRELERARVRDEVRRDAEVELQSRLEPMESQIRSLKDEPEINAAVEKLPAALEAVLPEDLKEVVAEAGGLEKFAESDPVLGDKIASVVSRGKEAVREYLRINRGLTKPDLGKVSADGERIEGGNIYHRWIADLLPKAGNWWAQHGGDGRFVDGKQFLPIAQYRQVLMKSPNAAKTKYWTFSEAQVVMIIEDQLREELKQTVNATQERLKKSGWQRPAKAKAAKETPPDGDAAEKKTKSPRVAPKPTGGGGPAKKRSALDFLRTTSRA